MLQTLEEKKNNLISSVCQQFTEGIVRFTTVSQYKLKYEQYLMIKNLGLCLDVMTPEGISKIL